MPVFPCTSTKTPMVKAWGSRASTDEDQIRAWFDKPEPPLIAIPTGERSGVWVLDVDEKRGVSGIDSLQKLCAEHGELPDTSVSLTTSGGLHYLFKYTEPVYNSSSRIGPNLDVRGEGGYFIAPPSRLNGRSYEWEASSAPIAAAPEWLLDRVRRVRPERPAEPLRAHIDSGRQLCGQAELARAVSALNAIRYDGTSRDDWVETGMGFKNATRGDGFEFFDVWSQAQPGYDAKHIGREWASWDPDGGVTAATLYHKAHRDGWRGLAIVRPSLGQPKREVPEAVEDAAPPTERMPLEPATRWHGRPIVAREWLLDQWIPMGEVTSLYGDGGLGKTLLMQQLATKLSVDGGQFMSIATVGGSVLAYFCEDSDEELHRRQAGVNRWLGVDFDELDRWFPVSRAGMDNQLMRFNAHGQGELTDFWWRVYEETGDINPVGLILDPAADLFGGKENDRIQVRQFIGSALRRLALDHECAVILLAHPSVYGLTSGTGTGGVTDWNNAVRSRLFLTRDEDGVTRLTRKKSNYSTSGDDVVLDLHWAEGVFWERGSSIEERTKESQARDFFFTNLVGQRSRGVYLSANPKGNYAPAALAQLPAARRGKLSRRDLILAMEALLADGELIVDEWKPGRFRLDTPPKNGLDTP